MLEKLVCPSPSHQERLNRIILFEEEFEQKEMWKKKYDWTCPSCGGLLQNIGGGIFKKNVKQTTFSNCKDETSDFLLECLVCQKQFVAGDDEIDEAHQNDPDYKAYLIERKRLDDYFNTVKIETTITDKWITPSDKGHDRAFVKIKNNIRDLPEFEIGWNVLEQLANRTGNLRAFGNFYPDEVKEYNSITEKVFNTIELSKPYYLTIHFHYNYPSWLQSTFFKKGPVVRSGYISSIRGLILEENKIGVDRRKKKCNHNAFNVN